MPSLTPLDPYNIFQSFFFLFLVGIIFFIAAILVIIFLFGWSQKDTLKNIKTVGVLLFLSLALPFSLTQVFLPKSYLSNALETPQILNLENKWLDQNSFLVLFQTSLPAVCYLEYQNNLDDLIPLLPSHSLIKRIDHSFIVPALKDTIIYINCNGKKYSHNGKPLVILKPQSNE